MWPLLPVRSGSSWRGIVRLVPDFRFEHHRAPLPVGMLVLDVEQRVGRAGRTGTSGVDLLAVAYLPPVRVTSRVRGVPGSAVRVG